MLRRKHSLSLLRFMREAATFKRSKEHRFSSKTNILRCHFPGWKENSVDKNFQETFVRIRWICIAKCWIWRERSLREGCWLAWMSLCGGENLFQERLSWQGLQTKGERTEKEMSSVLAFENFQISCFLVDKKIAEVNSDDEGELRNFPNSATSFLRDENISALLSWGSFAGGIRLKATSSA